MICISEINTKVCVLLLNVKFPFTLDLLESLGIAVIAIIRLDLDSVARLIIWDVQAHPLRTTYSTVEGTHPKSLIFVAIAVLQSQLG